MLGGPKEHLQEQWFLFFMGVTEEIQYIYYSTSFSGPNYTAKQGIPVWVLYCDRECTQIWVNES